MQKALEKAFENGDKIELGRIKLAIHGQGAAGKHQLCLHCLDKI